jgi:pyruvate kinase
MVKTKIIATLGPASSNPTVLRKMMLAGLDVVRLNFSHSNLNGHLLRINLIRQLNKKYHRHIRILGDLEGYRIRIGNLIKPFELKKNKIVYLTQKQIIHKDRISSFPQSGISKCLSSEPAIVSFNYEGDLRVISFGQHIYIDDGNLGLIVEGHEKGLLKCRVIVGGMLKEHKGVNIPDARLKFTGVTKKDKEDICFCVKQKVDFIAQSFVRTKEDILRVKDLIGSDLAGIKIIAKIENRQGIRNIDEIIEVSDGIMIARGDMGVSIPIYEVPIVQKEIIKKCLKEEKFVITATQMLESMIENLRPTRAEVSDVANAIIDGSDYLMLSAETAVGRYPVESVRMMNQVIKFTEKYLGFAG